MVHRAFGRLTLVNESGPDLTRSAAGRLVSELIWTPAAVLAAEIVWKRVDDHSVSAVVPYRGGCHEVTISVDPAGAPRTVSMLRWASIDRGPYRRHRFGAEIHRESTFGGFTVPTAVTAGYGFGGPRWPGCAFIQITVDGASYR